MTCSIPTASARPELFLVASLLLGWEGVWAKGWKLLRQTGEQRKLGKTRLKNVELEEIVVVKITYSLVIIVVVVKWFANHVIYCSASDANAKRMRSGYSLKPQMHLKVTYQAMQSVQSLHIHEVSISMLLRPSDVMFRESTRGSFLFRITEAQSTVSGQ